MTQEKHTHLDERNRRVVFKETEIIDVLENCEFPAYEYVNSEDEEKVLPLWIGINVHKIPKRDILADWIRKIYNHIEIRLDLQGEEQLIYLGRQDNQIWVMFPWICLKQIDCLKLKQTLNYIVLKKLEKSEKAKSFDYLTIRPVFGKWMDKKHFRLPKPLLIKRHSTYERKYYYEMKQVKDKQKYEKWTDLININYKMTVYPFHGRTIKNLKR
jgi:hypothetical protein